MEVNKKHIVQLQGKDFITYDGLLDMAHQIGLVSIETELIGKDPYIFKAIAKTETQIFYGHGDADNGNVNSMISKHKIRMAETRAKARALRDLTNVGMCSVEEMGGEESPTKSGATIADAKKVFKGKTPSSAQINALKSIAETFDLTPDDMKATMKELYGVNSSRELTPAQADDLLKHIEAREIDA